MARPLHSQNEGLTAVGCCEHDPGHGLDLLEALLLHVHRNIEDDLFCYPDHHNAISHDALVDFEVLKVVDRHDFWSRWVV